MAYDFLASDQRGNAGIIFALALLPLVALAGGAADLYAADAAKSALRDALDAALLAGATKLSKDDELAKTTAEDYLTTNASGIRELSYAFEVQDGVIRGEARSTSRTTFLGLVGIDSIPVEVRAAATAGPSQGGMELAIVVDVSGSMSGSIPSLRSSITELLGAIYAEHDKLDETWVAIVPFSGRVNVTNYGGSWFSPGQIPSSAAFSRVDEVGVSVNASNNCKVKTYSASLPRLCAARRTGDNQWTDAPPTLERFRMFGGSAEVCPVPRAQGLTSSRSILQQATNNLCSGHGTSTQEGIAWGWRAVSPRWRGYWGDPKLPLDYSDSPGKFVIIMTDGKNHTNQSGDPITDAQADAELLKTCDAMKREGITIYAITYKMGGSLSALYQRCTTAPDYEFAAETSSALTAAFVEIGQGIATGAGRVRLVE